MQDEYQDEYQATRVWDMVVEGSSEAPSLPVALSSVVDLIEGRVDAATANRVLWGGNWH
jgi:hypothetical protein